MDTYFSIGELSKLCNLPIKTLRYYDEVGLLKPAYINPDNNYRYYSIEQFISIDVIKNCKLMDMTLPEIKKILDSNVSIEEMIEITKRKSDLVEKKMQELLKAKEYMDILQNNFSDVLKYNMNEVFIKHNTIRYFTSYSYISKNTYELEMNIRKVILDLENKQDNNYGRLGTSVSYHQVVSEQRVVHKEVRSFSKSTEDKKGEVLPEGDYITLIFDDNSSNTLQYYKKVAEYIKEKGIKVEGDFNETWIMPRVDSERKEKTLTQIDILIKK